MIDTNTLILIFFGILLCVNAAMDWKTQKVQPRYWILPLIIIIIAIIQTPRIPHLLISASITCGVIVLCTYLMCRSGMIGGADFWALSTTAIILTATTQNYLAIGVFYALACVALPVAYTIGTYMSSIINCILSNKPLDQAKSRTLGTRIALIPFAAIAYWPVIILF